VGSIKVQQSNAWTIAVFAIIAVAPIISNIATLIGAVMFLVWLFKYRVFPVDYSSAVGRISVIILAYFAVMLFVTLIDEWSFRALQSMASISQFLYLGLLLPFLATKIKPISFSTIGYLATCTTLTVFVLAFIEHQFFLSFDSGFLIETSERIRPKWIGLYHGSRVALLTGNPNTVATILFPIVFLSVVGWRSKSLIWKVLAIFSLAVGLITTGIFAETRVTVVFAPLLLSLVWLYLFRVDRRFAYFLVALSSLSMLLLVFNWEVVSDSSLIRRMATLFLEIGKDSEDLYDGSVAQRLIMYKAGWASFLDSPWAGHGVHNKYEAIRSYFAGTALEGSNYRTTHNLFVTHAVVGGLLGILTIFVLIMFPIYSVLRMNAKLRSADDVFMASILTMSLMTLGMSETMLFNDAKNTLYIILFFLAAQLNDRKQPKLVS